MYDYRKIWERFYNKKIPKGWHIHHLDGDRFNNDIKNLYCCPAKEHREIHLKQGDLLAFIEMAVIAATKGGKGNKGKKKSKAHRRKIAKGVKKSNEIEEVKKKRSNAAKGSNNPMFGKPAWNKGKELGPFTEEHRIKISVSVKLTKALKRSA